MDKAVIFEAADADPARDRVVREGPRGRVTIVAIAEPGQLTSVARELVDAGARLIELCGGLSPTWRIKVSDAVDGRALISSVTYGIESLEAGARYKQGYECGEAVKEAFLLFEPGANPKTDRFMFDEARIPTLIVPVPDDEAAARAARELADDGFGLIELYGGLGTRGIALVIDAVAGRAAVGAGGFALDAALDPVNPRSRIA